MTTTTRESRGRILYTAYCRKVNFRAFNGDELPSFDNLDEERRDAWIFAANALWEIATTGHTTI